MPDTEHIGKYEILEELGRGGFATVYKARDTQLGIVALKVLHLEYAQQPQVMQRFLDEARRVFSLRHRGIVRVHAVEEVEGISYIAMEYLPGGTLADRLHGDPLPQDAAIAILQQVAAALDYAHKRKLIHRDVKPSNILFDDEGNAVLADFGLVKSELESGLTTTGTTVGTPYYIAPEQALGRKEIDGRADVYSLSVVAYQLLTGKVPFDADTPLAVFNAQIQSPPPDPRSINPDLDAGIVAVLLKGLEKQPDNRYATAGEFAGALRKRWDRILKTRQTGNRLEELYAQAQTALKDEQWDALMKLCLDMRNLNPDYRDVSTLLSLGASRLLEDEKRRQQEAQLRERYQEAIGLLDNAQYAEAVPVLEELEAEAADFEDVVQKLELARTELRLAEVYDKALASYEAEHWPVACETLLSVLRDRWDYQEGEAARQLLETVPGLLSQYQQQLEQVKELQSQYRQQSGELEGLQSQYQQQTGELKELQSQCQQQSGELEELQSQYLQQTREQEELQAKCQQQSGEVKKLRSQYQEQSGQVEKLQGLLKLYDKFSIALSQRDWALVVEVGTGILNLDPELQGLQPWLDLAQQQIESVKSPLQDESTGDTMIWEADGKEMVRIPLGKFLYGDDKQEVDLPEFWMDKTPVTNAEYACFVADTKRNVPEHWNSKTPSPEIADHPVVYVSWYDAVAYAAWAGKRLPTEQEWEKAARGTDGREYPWGNENPSPELCNYDNNEKGTTPVGKYSSQGDSVYGCVDMAGNVWEWTSSDYDKKRKVLRGGSWGYVDASDLRCAYRDWVNPANAGSDDDFRCAAGSSRGE